VQLQGIPETTLWTLYMRAVEAGRACRRRFPGGGLIFDAIPRWLSERSQRGGLKGPAGYEPPPWLWGIDTSERRRLGARRLRAPHGRGIAGSLVLPQLLYVLAIRF
jgi:hypothetical protein